MASDAPFAEGGNFRCELSQGVAVCRVWKRADVDSVTGARFAEQKIGVSERLLREPVQVARGFVLDLREAPSVIGPITEESLAKVLAMWEAAGRRIAVLVSESATQSLQWTRMVNEHAKKCGLASRDLSEAMAWANGGARASALRGQTHPRIEVGPRPRIDSTPDTSGTRRAK